MRSLLYISDTEHILYHYSVKQVVFFPLQISKFCDWQKLRTYVQKVENSNLNLSDSKLYSTSISPNYKILFVFQIILIQMLA